MEGTQALVEPAPALSWTFLPISLSCITSWKTAGSYPPTSDEGIGKWLGKNTPLPKWKRQKQNLFPRMGMEP